MVTVEIPRCVLRSFLWEIVKEVSDRCKIPIDSTQVAEINPHLVPLSCCCEFWEEANLVEISVAVLLNEYKDKIQRLSSMQKIRGFNPEVKNELVMTEYKLATLKYLPLFNANLRILEGNYNRLYSRNALGIVFVGGDIYKVTDRKIMQQMEELLNQKIEGSPVHY